jgi:methyl-accepting chemotaxis protein
VQEISAESGEQATGIVQIGQAVAQMEQVTQQNAALVEQAAAAAGSLEAQARQLENAVSSFRLVPQT